MIWIIGIILAILCLWIFNSLKSITDKWVMTIKHPVVREGLQILFTLLSAFISILLFLGSVFIAVLLDRAGGGSKK